MEPSSATPPDPFASAASAEELLATLPWGVLVLDERHVIRLLNQQAARWCGVQAAALLGQSLPDAPLPPAIRASLQQLLHPPGAATPLEVWLPQPAQWLAFSAMPQPRGGWVVHGQDITPQKQREQQYQALAENTPDVLTRWTPDLRLRYANAAFAAKTGLPLAATLGHTLPELALPAEVSGPYEAALRRVFETGQPQQHYHDFAAPWGLVRYDVRLVPELHDGSIETVLAIARDITALRQAEADTLGLRDALTQQATDQYQALLYSMDEGLCVMEMVFDESGEQAVDCYYREFNLAFTRQSGMPTSALNQSSRALLPNQEPFWLATYGRVARTGEPIHFEHYMPAPIGRWFRVQAYRVGGPGSARVAALFSDVTARKQAETRQAFRLTLSEALAAEMGPEGVQQAVTDAARRYFGADRCYYCEIEDGAAIIRRDAAREGLPSVAGTYQLADFPLLQAAIDTGRPFVVEDVQTSAAVDEALRQLCVSLHVIAYLNVPVLRHGRVVGELCLVQGTPRRWTAAETELALEIAERTAAVVARVRTERALRDSEARLKSAVGVADLGTFVWHVAEDRTEEDARARAHFGLPPGGTVSLAEALATTFHPDDAARYAAAVGRAIDPAGPGTLYEEFRVRHPDGQQRWLAVSGRTAFEGTPRTALRLAGVLADITERKRRETDLALLAEISQDLAGLTNIDDTLNALGEKLAARLGLSACLFAEMFEGAQTIVIGHGWHRADMPNLLRTYRTAEFMDEIRALCLTGRPVVVRDVWADPRTEGPQYAALHIGSFVGMPLVRDGEWRFLLVVYRSEAHDWHPDEIDLIRETTARIWARLERARAEQALRESEERFRNLVESYTQAVWETDAAGQVVRDSPSWRAYTGQTEAQWLGYGWVNAIHPDDRAYAGRQWQEAVAAGRNVNAEFRLRYAPDGYRWTNVRATPIRDAQGHTHKWAGMNIDIHDRKTTEEALRASEGRLAGFNQHLEQQVATRTQELVEYVGLLEQSEQVAQLGSWVADLVTGELRWSAGMYQLFSLAPGTRITPALYLDYVVPDDRPVAERVVQALTTAPADLTEMLRIRVGAEVKVLRLKAVVLRDEQGTPTQVLGIDFDVTELQRLEADNLRLRLSQQQALFEAVQAAEEEERRRMSESLHNGIGQILYATKLQLDRLPAEPGPSPRTRAAELLSDAIRQTRALSHELTPAILEEYGLEATLRSMCSSLNSPALRWHCHFVLDEGPTLAPALQLAVYRLAQELAQNVLKHAQASQATLEVEVLSAWLVLRVEDNGRGFDPVQTSDGLGLRTLRSRVALLGGSVHLTTTPGRGTQCQVRLPSPLPPAS